MSLLEELLGRPIHVRKGLSGRRVTFALDGEIAHERKLVEEDARERAKREAADFVPSSRPTIACSRHLVLAALRDGRARFEGDICEVSGLRHFTVVNALHRLRRKGEAEQHFVGNYTLWSRTFIGEDE